MIFDYSCDVYLVGFIVEVFEAIREAGAIDEPGVVEDVSYVVHGDNVTGGRGLVGVEQSHVRRLQSRGSCNCYLQQHTAANSGH